MGKEGDREGKKKLCRKSGQANHGEKERETKGAGERNAKGGVRAETAKALQRCECEQLSSALSRSPRAALLNLLPRAEGHKRGSNKYPARALCKKDVRCRANASRSLSMRDARATGD